MNSSPTVTPETQNSHSEQPVQATPIAYKKDELVSSTFVLQLVIALVVLLVSLKLFAHYVLKRSGQSKLRFEVDKEAELRVRSSVKLSIRTRIHHVSLGDRDFLVMESTNQSSVHEVGAKRFTSATENASPSAEEDQ